VRRLNERAALFLQLARERGLDVGGSIGASIVPVITGSSINFCRGRPAAQRRQKPALYCRCGPFSFYRAEREHAGLANRSTSSRKKK
jgi:hypothetical protein